LLKPAGIESIRPSYKNNNNLATGKTDAHFRRNEYDGCDRDPGMRKLNSFIENLSSKAFFRAPVSRPLGRLLGLSKIQ
jgi:hypothetical protein